jgi:hypothetical protein
MNETVQPAPPEPASARCVPDFDVDPELIGDRYGFRHFIRRSQKFAIKFAEDMRAGRR